MALITLRDACLAFGDRPLLDGAALAVRDGERLGFIGRNGTGKSTVLKIIAGLTALDEGELQRRTGLRLALLEQEPQLPPAPTLRESLIERARTLAHASSCTPEQLHGTDRERWQLHSRLAEYLQRLGLTGDESPQDCSGGERKRAALALALAGEPELLLLDEPTNHLDIDGIALLEEHVRRMPAALIVTHDRAFLDAVATRIVELDRGVIRSYLGNFAAYEVRRDQEAAAEDVARRRFEKFWQQEEVWIRKGVEARRTRNEGRVRRLEQLREQRTERRDRIGRIKLALDAGERSGRLVAELIGVGQTFSSRTLIEDFSTRILRGDRVGFIGPNGAGKSTLLRIILGTHTPERGSVRLGTNLQIAYFDQMREQLDPRATLAESISPGSDWITVAEERKHVITYLGDFLFPPHRAQSPVEMLSGGERNRLLLARLFARPANVLVLDEPTNDLDIPTLEILEESLLEFPGALLLVTHDRYLLDRVTNAVLGLDGLGNAALFADYLQWEAWRDEQARAASGVPAEETPKPTAAAPSAPPRKKLSYIEQREYDGIEARIEEANARLRAAEQRIEAPEVVIDSEALTAALAELEQAKAEHHAVYERWLELTEKIGG